MPPSSATTSASGKTRAEDISNILRDEILLVQYRAGERLPSERDLAGRFQVNRGAIREAIKTLAELGIVQVQPGGVRINPLEQASLSVLGPLLDLKAEVRPEVVSELVVVFGALLGLSGRLALAQATADQRAELLQILERIDPTSDVSDQDEQFRSVLEAFGKALGGIHNNLVLRLIRNGLRTQMVGRLLPKQPSPVTDRQLLKDMAIAIEANNGNQLAMVISRHFDDLSVKLSAIEADIPTFANRQRNSGHA